MCVCVCVCVGGGGGEAMRDPGKRRGGKVGVVVESIHNNYLLIVMRI